MIFWRIGWTFWIFSKYQQQPVYQEVSQLWEKSHIFGSSVNEVKLFRIFLLNAQKNLARRGDPSASKTKALCQIQWVALPWALTALEIINLCINRVTVATTFQAVVRASSKHRSSGKGQAWLFWVSRSIEDGHSAMVMWRVTLCMDTGQSSVRALSRLAQELISPVIRYRR